MTPQNRLLTACTNTCRQIWASMPFGLRLAELLLRLAEDQTQNFGRTMYGEFLMKGVQGMPPIRGVPAESTKFWHAQRNPADSLPTNYGSDFGNHAWRTLMKKVPGISLADAKDALQDTAIDFVGGASRHLDETFTLEHAEYYVINAVVNRGKMSLRSRSRRREDYVREDTEKGGVPNFDHVDRDSIQDFNDFVKARSMQKIMPQILRDLERAHPAAADYVRLVLETGLPENQIVGDPRKGVPSMIPYLKENPITPQGFNFRVKPKIREVFQRYRDDLAPTPDEGA